MDVTAAPGKASGDGRQRRHSGGGRLGSTTPGSIYMRTKREATDSRRQAEISPILLTPSCLQKRLPECSLKVTGAFVRFQKKEVSIRPGSFWRFFSQSREG